MNSNYWDTVTETGIDSCSQLLWRTHCDAVNRSLVSRWLPGEKFECLLKTDLFDEAVADGVYPFLKSIARNVVGIDVSVFVVKGALKHHNSLQGTLADIRSLPFAGEAIDLILSISTLDHFKTHDQIIFGLRELFRVLRLGGRLILTLDNPANLLVALRNILPYRLLNRLGIVPYFIGATFGLPQVIFQLKRLGFHVTRTTSVMHCPRVFAVVLSSILERFGTPSVQKRYLKILMWLERLEKWPGRDLTGHFTAVLAEKPKGLNSK